MSIDEMMLEALKTHLKNQRVEWESGISSEEWQALFQLAEEHSILPIVFEAVYSCAAAAAISPETLETLRGTVRNQVVQQMQRTAELFSLYKALSDNDVRPCVVKGIICRELYPSPDYRMSSDEDFWISWEDFRQTDVIMQKWGMVPVDPQKDIEAEFEVPYYNPGGRLVVELHKDLFSRESDAYGDFNALFSDARQHAVRKDCGGMEIWTMNETDHFVYLVAHAFKHFLHGGFGIRQVCDIVLFGKKYEDEIDWQTVYQKCEMMHAACFTAALLDIGKKQLDCCPCRQEELDVWKRISVDSGDLLADLMDSGIYGAKNLSRKHSSTITLSAVAAKRQGKTTEGSICRTLFPSAKDIAGRYLYLKKFPFLLPIAWADRLWGYYKENKNRGGQQQAAESVQLGRQRVELLKKYKIID